MSNIRNQQELMENYEFVALADGNIIARNDTANKVVTEFDRDIIEFVIKEIKVRYPIAYERLCIIYDRYKGNRLNYEYLIAKRFIRCNMGADDLMTIDVEQGVVNLEFVSCPMRGECPYEGVVCRPRHHSHLTPTLKQVAELYASGKSYQDIADVLGKSPKTIANQLRAIKEILKLKRVKDIITYRILYNF